MDEKKEKQIINDIRKLANNAVNIGGGHIISYEKYTKTITKDGTRLLFTDSYVDLYAKIIDDILQQDNWDRTISKKYAEDAVDGFIVKILTAGDGIVVDSFKELIKDFEIKSSNECVVYMPIFEISMKINSIKLGKIKLIRLTDEKISEIKDQIRIQYLKTSSDDDTKRRHIEHIYKFIDAYLKEAPTCVEFRMFAESNRTVERAIEEAQRVMDLFRFVIPTFFSWNNGAFIGLQREYSYQHRYVLVVGEDSLISTLVNVSPLTELVISHESLKHMGKFGVFKLNKIMRKDDPSDFERTLLLGLKWFSRSQIHKEPINQFMDLITCLEIFLNRGKGEPVLISLSEGAAILLCDDIKDRRKIKDDISYFYDIRSTLTHGGVVSLENRDINHLMSIIGSLIEVLLERKDEFENKDTLINWLEYKRLGGKTEEWPSYQEFLKYYKKLKPKKTK